MPGFFRKNSIIPSRTIDTAVTMAHNRVMDNGRQTRLKELSTRFGLRPWRLTTEYVEIHRLYTQAGLYLEADKNGVARPPYQPCDYEAANKLTQELKSEFPPYGVSFEELWFAVTGTWITRRPGPYHRNKQFHEWRTETTLASPQGSLDVDPLTL